LHLLYTIFKDFNGCFVLFDKNENEYSIYNEAKSQTRISPCSTFKIVNSLFGLETGVLQDENTMFKWSGKQYGISEWNKDQTMASAFRDSVVWYYQKVASGVGTDRMQKYLNSIRYGNANMSGGLTHFWLDSSLKISPLEQIELLKKFYSYQLQFSSRNIDIVKKIMLISNNNGVRLSGKTGAAGQKNGWFIGFAEKKNDVYYFAANIEGKKNATGINARSITLKILKDKKILQ
jgi:beta-lactamase class D